MIEYNFQKLTEKVVVWSDKDFAGGVVMFGNHCIKAYSQTQETIVESMWEVRGES